MTFERVLNARFPTANRLFQYRQPEIEGFEEF